MICKDPTIGVNFVVILGPLNKIPKYIELFFQEQKL